MSKPKNTNEGFDAPVCSVASNWDHRIIEAVSVALSGRIGQSDDIQRLRQQIEDGCGEDKLAVACEIAVAFIRWSQDLRRERNSYRDLLRGRME